MDNFLPSTEAEDISDWSMNDSKLVGLTLDEYNFSKPCSSVHLYEYAMQKEGEDWSALATKDSDCNCIFKNG